MTAAKPRLLHLVLNVQNEEKEMDASDTSESICTATASPRACDWKTDGII